MLPKPYSVKFEVLISRFVGGLFPILSGQRVAVFYLSKIKKSAAYRKMQAGSGV